MLTTPSSSIVIAWLNSEVVVTSAGVVLLFAWYRYGFGQVPMNNLSAVGTAMLLASSAANLDNGQSHAPAPFYISVQGDDGLSHGVLLATTRYSMWDIGHSAPDEIRIHTADPIIDYFLMAGPTPAAVQKQLGTLCGLPPQPPPWALGFKYHTQNALGHDEIVAAVKNFSDHGIPLSHVVVENYYDSGHRLDPTRFTTPAALVAACKEYASLSSACKWRDVGCASKRYICLYDCHGWHSVPECAFFVSCVVKVNAC